MTTYEIEIAQQRVDNARRLGGFDKTCALCGEPNARCLELHHVAKKDYGTDLVPLCRNCHRKATDKRDNKKAPEYPCELDRIGHWLLGVAELLLLLALRALEYGSALIEAAKVCPSPYGIAEKVMA